MAQNNLKIASILVSILVLILLVGSVGCSNLDPFPTKEVYFRGPDFCDKYKIIKERPLTFDKGEAIGLDACPQIVVGFKSDDVAGVIDWIRVAQSKIGKKR
jgi:hypothetical protein